MGAPSPSGATASTTATATASAAPTTAPKTTSDGFVEVKTDTFDGVIFPSESAGELGVREIDHQRVEGTWTPTPNDVTVFERGLDAFVRLQGGADSKRIPAKLTKYKRQWAGFLAHGKRKIFGNFFCSEQPDWRHHVIEVDDGGDCFFQIEFDVDSKTYSDFSVNGVG